MRQLPKICMTVFFCITALTGAAMTGAALADVVTVGSVEISGAWARPSITKNGAAYFTLTNKGTQADALTGVTSSVADKVQIHEMEMDGTIMRMRALSRLPIAAGASVSAEPGGTHIMLIGLKAPLVAGTMIKLHLTFEKAGETEITIPVQPQP